MFMNLVSHNLFHVARIALGLGLLVIFDSSSSMAKERTHIAACNPPFAFRPVSNISVIELSRFSTHTTVRNKLGDITFIEFDEEDHPEYKGVSEAGFFMATSSDLGSTPFAGILMTNYSNIIIQTRKGIAESAVLEVKAVDAKTHCKGSTTFVFSNDGVVQRDGVKIGEAH
jgi:hypothetical protein